MTLNLTIPQMTHTDFSPRITVIGVGGGGTNAVDNMIALNLRGVDFVVANTDAQQLMRSRAERRIQLGPHMTQGLGAGAKPEIGRAAAEEAADELFRHLDGAHMVFITAGMGGGTGTGAAPVIARMARERGILTVGVVTRPFSFEGPRRARVADAGIAELHAAVDTLIVIPNQNLFGVSNRQTTFLDAFKKADEVLYMGVRSVTDLMMTPGLVNLDFADIRAVMREMGKAMMGTGEAEGEGRAIAAAEAAIRNPLLEEHSMKGARGLLINITGGEDMTLMEVDEAANCVRAEVDEDANIIFGSAIDEDLIGKIRVSVVATGIDNAHAGEMPRLVAMGGGAAVAMAEPAPSVIREAAVTPLRAAHRAPTMLREAQPMGSLAEPQTAEAVAEMAVEAEPGSAVPMSPAQAAAQMAAQATGQMAAPAPGSRPAPRSGLFAEAPQAAAPAQPAGAPGAPEAPRPSLFSTVTGAFRRRPVAPQTATEPPPVRMEPVMPEIRAEAPRTQMQQATSDEMGHYEIPAFLRRQTS